MSEVAERSEEEVCDGYKRVELGPKQERIPAEWDTSKLEEVAVKVGGKKPDRIEDSPSEDTVPYLTIDALKNGAERFARLGDGKECFSDDLLMVWDGASSGKVYEGQRGVIGSTLSAIRFDEQKISSEYAYYVLTSLENAVASLREGGSIAHVPKDFMSVFELPKPSIDEQRRVAAVLSTVDEEIRGTEEIIETTEELKRGLMQDLLTKGTENSELRSVQLGLQTVELPRDWKVERVEDIFEIRKNPFRPSENEGEVFLYSMPAYDEDKEPKRVGTSEIGSKKRRVPNATILFPKLNIRKRRFWRVDHDHEIPAICSTEFLPLVPTSELVLDFYAYYFDSDTFMRNPKISSSSSTNSHMRVKQQSFEKIRLPVPPVDEQQKIASILEKTDTKLLQERNKKQKLHELKRALMQDLLTGEVRTPSDLLETDATTLDT